jgi:hypothetical protein
LVWVDPVRTPRCAVHPLVTLAAFGAGFALGLAIVELLRLL